MWHKIPLPAKAAALPAALHLDDTRFLHNHGGAYRIMPQYIPQFDLPGFMCAPEQKTGTEGWDYVTVISVFIFRVKLWFLKYMV